MFDLGELFGSGSSAGGDVSITINMTAWYVGSSAGAALRGCATTLRGLPALRGCVVTLRGYPPPPLSRPVPSSTAGCAQAYQQAVDKFSTEGLVIHRVIHSLIHRQWGRCRGGVYSGGGPYRRNKESHCWPDCE